MANAATCPFCRTPADGPTLSCPECGLAYHDDCWAENMGCAVPGCAGHPVEVSAPEVPSAAHGVEAPYAGGAIAAVNPTGATQQGADWKADPTGKHRYRWWDGELWTDYVSDAGETSIDPLQPAPPPPTTPPAAPPFVPATVGQPFSAHQVHHAPGQPVSPAGPPHGSSPTFGDAIQICFKKYVEFSGRAGKAEFWWFFLFCSLVMFVTVLISDVLFGFAILGLLLPYLAVGSRRLHDTGNPAPLLLIQLIPYIGGIVLLFLFAAKPDPGSNKFGPVPW
jgi:uncharacterized membrane protein YhaH (DUF805 family)